jgi:hypothetical protein
VRAHGRNLGLINTNLDKKKKTTRHFPRPYLVMRGGRRRAQFILIIITRAACTEKRSSSHCAPPCEREREKIVGVINEAVADEIIYAIEHTFGVKFLRKSLARRHKGSIN